MKSFNSGKKSFTSGKKSDLNVSNASSQKSGISKPQSIDVKKNPQLPNKLLNQSEDEDPNDSKNFIMESQVTQSPVNPTKKETTPSALLKNKSNETDQNRSLSKQYNNRNLASNDDEDDENSGGEIMDRDDQDDHDDQDNQEDEEEEEEDDKNQILQNYKKKNNVDTATNNRNQVHEANEKQKLEAINAEYEKGEEYEQEVRNQILELSEGKIPENERKIIEYLLGRLDEVEAVLSQTQKVMFQNESRIQDVEKELDEKMKIINELESNERETLEKKIENKMKNFLEVAARRTFEAKEERDKIAKRIIELEYLVTELDDTIYRLHKDGDGLHTEIKIRENKIHSLEQTIVQLAEQNKNMKLQSSEQKLKVESLERENESLKNILKNLNDVKNVLNRYMGSNEKDTELPEVMEKLKSTLLMEPQILPTKNTNGNNKQLQSSISNTNVKKDNYLTNDEDFWYSEKKDIYAADYGGRRNDGLGNYSKTIGKLDSNQLKDNQGSKAKDQDVDDFLEMNKASLLSTEPNKKSKLSSNALRNSSQSVQLMNKNKQILPNIEENPNKLPKIYDPKIHEKLYQDKKQDHSKNNKNAFLDHNEFQSLLRPKGQQSKNSKVKKQRLQL